MWQVLTVLIIVLCLAYLYKRYETKYLYDTYDENVDMRKYLLGELTREDIGRIRKPLLWVYVPHEYNSRHWLSFGSRSSYELNQPYLYLTTKSILKHCNKDFHVILIDDNSFPKLLENWPYSTAVPLDKTKRLLGLMNIIHTYGGMMTPISFICLKSLIDMYYNGTRDDKMVVVENVNHTSIVENVGEFALCPFFSGCLKGNKTVAKFIGFLNNIIGTDYTFNYKITGEITNWLSTNVNSRQIHVVRGYEVGVMTVGGKPILIEDLIGTSHIDINLQNIYGVWVPAEQILNRTSYQWFARLSEEQVLLSNTNLGKYIVKAIAPTPEQMAEGFQTQLQPMIVGAPNSLVPQSNPTEWVGFWNTPLYKGLYGLQPLYLGQEVPKNRDQGNGEKYVGVIP